MSTRKSRIIILGVILTAIISLFFIANNHQIEYNEFVKQTYGGEFVKQSIDLQKYIREKFVNPVSEQIFSSGNIQVNIISKDLAYEKEEVYKKISKLEHYVNSVDDKGLNKEQVLDHNILKEDIMKNLKDLRKNIEECETILIDDTKDIDERFLKYQEKLIYPLESINANIKAIDN
ncbi:hypothetical protein ABB02_00152 [Clostridiaceae bacterium JG1575]|nr:hypothetical protein ABB02_00152 [Clostridiaceae bacterium JG1575]